MSMPLRGQAIPISAKTEFNHEEVVRRVIAILFRQRRLLPQEANQAVDSDLEARPHIDNIRRALNEKKPLQLILPAFPGKSPNRQKTLGHLPDFAEKHSLRQLSSLIRELAEIYPHGVKIVICSDGRVFADLVRIPDSDITEYGMHLREYADQQIPDCVEFFNLDDLQWNIKDYDSLREELLIRYSEPMHSVRRLCASDDSGKAMYQGITRFIFEDFSGLDCYKSLSKTQVQKLARNIAYRVIQRSNAWSNLLEEMFPHAIRLSIHPQLKVSKKIGVYLGDKENCWTTPWHSVAVLRDKEVIFLKRRDAEQLNAKLVYEDNRPSHFEVPAEGYLHPVRNTNQRGAV